FAIHLVSVVPIPLELVDPGSELPS
ncbi:hypothetical protein BAL199_00035, partial [alpha proteobacterium BAL199]